MTNTIPFGKSYTSPHDLVSLLQIKGLYIPDALKAEHYLEHIGYYRLSAYMHPLLEIPKEHHLYKQGATFSKVMMLYRFDKKLRGSRYLVGIGIYFGKSKKKETFIYNSS